MGDCGVYIIRNTVNGNCYVGSSIRIRRRWQYHASMLRLGKHVNKHLQAAYDKYGEAAFTYDILETVADRAELTAIEERYILDLRPEYNLCQTARAPNGYKHTDEARRKIAEASRRRWDRDGERERASQAAKENPETMGRLEAIHQSRIGYHHSEETIEKMRQSAQAQSEQRRETMRNIMSERWTHPEFREKVMRARGYLPAEDHDAL